MIINQTRIKTGGAKNVIAHVNKTDKNEVCERLFGLEEDLLCDDENAGKKTYSVRHFTISPDSELSSEQFDDLLKMLDKEFDFKDRSVVAYKHVKERADGNKTPHFHVLVSEQNFDGKTMSNRHNYVRNEKVARIAELKFGHKQTKGAHNRAVMQAAPDKAKHLFKEISEGPRPVADYSKGALAKAQRLGVDLPKIANEMRALRGKSHEEIATKLKELETIYNVNITKGDRKDVLLIKTKSNELICNANKALAIKAKDVREIVKYQHASAASLHEKGARSANEKSRNDPANFRADTANKRLHVRASESTEQSRPGTRTRGPDSTISRTADSNITKSDSNDRDSKSSIKSAERTDRSVQLSSSSSARSKLKKAVISSSTKNAKQPINFGNSFASSEIATSPPALAISTDDPNYASKVLQAWSQNQQMNSPRY